ncbi:MAG: peptidylprolyl isomerase [Chloroflexaceae bacterium]|nr:peptidylprolyl isomerase [Chloroflexaceae bacterium]
MIIGAVLGLALLILAGGITYQQVWVPSRPLAQVGSTTLTRRDYWQESRIAIAQEIAQNLQLLRLFGSDAQFSSQFAGRSPVLNQQVELLGSEPENEQVITRWIDGQIIEQGAASLSVQVTDDQINQALTQSYAAFLPPAPPLDSSTGVTDTLDLEDQTPPTPEAAQARDQVDQIAAEIYAGFIGELELTGVEPNLTQDDFRQALLEQQRRQSLQGAVEEQLVPEAAFSPSSEPERIQARQILFAVELPENPSQGVVDTAYAEALAAAEATLAELQAGTDFAELAAQRSDDAGSAQQGGDVGSFDRDGVSASGATYAPEFVAAAFALDEGELSAPVRTQFGWHIIEVTSRDAPDLEQQLREARRAAFDTWREEQRTALNATRIPAPTPDPEAAPSEDLPTPAPTFQPGPPTAPALPDGFDPQGEGLQIEGLEGFSQEELEGDELPLELEPPTTP